MLREIEPAMPGGQKRCRLPREQRERIIVEVKMQKIEFLIVTRWNSMAAIEKFAGADVEAAVIPDTVKSMMLEYDGRVRHYEVVKE